MRIPTPPSVCLPVLGGLLTAMTPVLAQDRDTMIDQVVERMLPADWEQGSVGGDGGAFLLEQAEQSFAFLIGESHGNQETCALTSWLLGALAPRGYGVLATETGPVSTAYAVDIVRKQGLEGLLQFHQQQPFTIAFLNWREENPVWVKAIEENYAIWGLDQEFIGSGRFLLGRLKALAPDAECEQLATQWVGRAMQAAAEVLATGDRSKLFLNTVTEDDFAELDAAYADAGDDARQILSELRATARIYRHYREGRGYWNNHDRIRLMKRHLADRLTQQVLAERLGGREGGEQSKVLMRFGSAHMGRGYSPFDQLDLGNQAAELAYARGSDSFHLMVFARESVQADGSVRDFSEGTPGYDLFYEVMEPGETAVFDLRALRPLCSRRSVRENFSDLRDLVFRFDALLILPRFHRSEDLVKLDR